MRRRAAETRGVALEDNLIRADDQERRRAVELEDAPGAFQAHAGQAQFLRRAFRPGGAERRRRSLARGGEPEQREGQETAAPNRERWGEQTHTNSERWRAEGLSATKESSATGVPDAAMLLLAATPTRMEAAPCSWPAERPSGSAGGWPEKICSCSRGSLPPWSPWIVGTGTWYDALKCGNTRSSCTSSCRLTVLVPLASKRCAAWNSRYSRRPRSPVNATR